LFNQTYEPEYVDYGKYPHLSLFSAYTIYWGEAISYGTSVISNKTVDISAERTAEIRMKTKC